MPLKDIRIVVSLFHDRQYLGKMDAKKAAVRLRLGIDTLYVRNGLQNGIMLSYMPVHHDWSKEAMALALLKKAKIKETACEWNTYTTTSWLSGTTGARVLDKGYPDRKEFQESGRSPRDYIDLICRHIIRHINPRTHIPEYSYWPAKHAWTGRGTSARILLSLGALQDGARFLGNTAYEDAAIQGLRYCASFFGETGSGIRLAIPTLVNSSGDESCLLLAMAKENNLRALPVHKIDMAFQRVLSFFNPEGFFSAGSGRKRLASDQDFLPGISILALSRFFRLRGYDPSAFDFAPFLRWYRNRWALLPSWAMVWWQVQAWTSVYTLTGDGACADFCL